MIKPIIEVQNISKIYLIGSRQPYYSLRDTIANTARKPLHFFKKAPIESQINFWALKNVSFTVKPGEVLGIIGRNGSGKSTLLKILSQITPPTKGKVILRGRASSLLEVGTGFHPELTGRENIYLNGAILGMKRIEIKNKFDEIVNFAEIEEFLDTPVKHYSSGMYTRLAFAVAAHLEPEILIVDEVLAVGDAAFQKKCLGKMNRVSKEGKTVIFVSHNMEAIRQLCPQTIFLEKGQIAKYGQSSSVTDFYLSGLIPKNRQDISVKAKVINQKEWTIGSKLSVEVSWKSIQLTDTWECDLVFYHFSGAKLFALQSALLAGYKKTKNACGIKFIITNPGFTEKEIRVDVGIKSNIQNPDYEFILENCLNLKPSARGLNNYVHQKNDEGVIVPSAQCQILS